MEVTHLLAVYLLVALSVRASLAHEETAVGITEESITEDQRKVYDECRNPDYKKYVKCLMRPKRHHHTDHGDVTLETDSAHCLEACLKKCDHHLDHNCEKKCSYCTKKTRHRHQIITEYETECVSGNCNLANGDGQLGQLKTTNITTNIGINNVINTFDKRICSPDGLHCFNKTDNITDIIDGRGCCAPGCSPCVPTIPIVPQISLVPQITYGVGFGAAGGCAYNQWLCIQQGGIREAQPDCSGCGNPVLRHACDVRCYSTYTKTDTKRPESHS